MDLVAFHLLSRQSECGTHGHATDAPFLLCMSSILVASDGIAGEGGKSLKQMLMSGRVRRCSNVGVPALATDSSCDVKLEAILHCLACCENGIRVVRYQGARCVQRLGKGMRQELAKERPIKDRQAGRAGRWGSIMVVV